MPPAPFPFQNLARPLAPRTRARLRAHLAALLDWQRSLSDWPGVLSPAPDATPFVSLYSRGKLTGCFGSGEGSAGERVSRAFLLALADPRGGVRADMRASLAAQLAYPISPLGVSPEEALSTLEPGTHGVALARDDGTVVPVLPMVARERHTGARGMLEIAARKAGLDKDAWQHAKGLWLFATEDVSARAGDTPEGTDERTEDQAARWLAARVQRDGSVQYEIDARAGGVLGRGEGYHARAAVALRALAAHGGFAREAKRGAKWLRNEIARGLGDALGRAEAFPAEPARVAGVLALGARAGACEAATVARWASAHAVEIARAPWYAAQVVCVLGASAPPGLWNACVTDLEARPFAPWTLMAAQALGDSAVRERCAKTLCESLREDGVHAGGASATEVPEVALTATAVEALVESRSTSASERAAVARARTWLRRWQLVRGKIPAALDPAWAEGAFPASPVNDRLRCDVTGHALLALLGA